MQSQSLYIHACGSFSKLTVTGINMDACFLDACSMRMLASVCFASKLKVYVSLVNLTSVNKINK